MNAFQEALESARESSKLTSRHLERSMRLINPSSSPRYETKTYGRGMFYYDGAMYYTDDGSIVPEDNCLAQEMLRIQRVIA